MFYTIGMNLINNRNPTENTNYKTVNGEIIVPYPYDIYMAKIKLLTRDNGGA